MRFRRFFALALFFIVIVATPLSIVSIVGCTQNQKARNFGGTTTIDLQVGKKFVNASWKTGNDLWYVVRDAKAGEESETYEFIEDSSLGLMNGKVIFKEHIKK